MNNFFNARRAVSALALVLGTSFAAASCSREQTVGGAAENIGRQAAAVVQQPLRPGTLLDIAENGGANETTDALGLTIWAINAVETLQPNPIDSDAGWSVLRAQGRAGGTIMFAAWVYINFRGLQGREDLEQAFVENTIVFIDPSTPTGELELDVTQVQQLIASLGETVKGAVANRDAANEARKDGAAGALGPDSGALANTVEGPIDGKRGAPRNKAKECDEPMWLNGVEAVSCTLGGVGVASCTLIPVPGIGSGAVFSCVAGIASAVQCYNSIQQTLSAFDNCDCKINGNGNLGPGGSTPIREVSFCDCAQESAVKEGSSSVRNFGRGVLSETQPGIYQCFECPANTKVDRKNLSTANDDVCVCSNGLPPISTEGDPGVDPSTGEQGEWTSTCEQPHTPMCRSMQQGDSFFPRWEYCCDGDGFTHEFPPAGYSFNCPVGQHYRVHSGPNFGAGLSGCYPGTCQNFGLDPSVEPAIE